MGQDAPGPQTPNQECRGLQPSTLVVNELLLAAVRAQSALGEEQQGVVYLTMINGVLDLYVD